MNATGARTLRWQQLSSRQRFIALSTVPALVAVGLGCYSLSLPNNLFGVQGPDDAIYLGAATRLVHGLLPYKDYVFLHPPGIAILMAPIAAVGQLIGTEGALAIARCVTVLVEVLNVVLVGCLLRRRGAVALLIGEGLVACFPFYDRGTLSLEPYRTLFCLVGLICVFLEGELATPRRIFVGGLALGVAGSVKIWAILPVVVVLACCVPRWKRAVLPLLAGTSIGFGVVSLPFVLFAPRAFVHDVVVTQITRVGILLLDPSNGNRIVTILGFGERPGLIPGLFKVVPGVADALLTAIAVVIIGAFASARRSLTRFDWCLFGSATITVWAMLFSPVFLPWYAYFPFVFIALVLAASIARLADLVAAKPWHSKRLPRRATAAGALLVIAAAAVVIRQDTAYSRVVALRSFGAPSAIDARIPAGACTIFDSDGENLAVAANRFLSSDPGCPHVVDPYGTSLSFNPLTAETSASTSYWSNVVTRAQFGIVANSGPPDLLQAMTSDMTIVFGCELPDHRGEVFIYAEGVTKSGFRYPLTQCHQG